MMRSAISLLPPLLLAGCVTPGEIEGLPTGAILLDLAKGYCDGPLEISGAQDLVVDEGASATFAVGYDNDLAWACQDGPSMNSGLLTCPGATSYVRITRAVDGSAFTLECFGT